MLPAILRSHHRTIAQLAQAWLTSGATSFSLWQQDGEQFRILRGWPDGSTAEPVSLCADILVDVQGKNSAIGQLRAAGISYGQARLAADAALIASLCRAEDELQAMTGELVESHDQLLAVYGLTQSMRRHLHVDDVLHSLARETMRMINAGNAFTLIVEEGTLVNAQYPRPFLDAATLADLFESLQTAENTRLTLDKFLLVPIKARETLIAVLGLTEKSGGFTSPDLKLVGALAEQAGALIENVLLYQEHLARARVHTEMELARRVQMRLLPHKTPAVANLDIYAASHAAYQVGGDFYDFVELPDSRLTFFLGDVTGKGMPSALLMAMTRTLLRSTAQIQADATPERIMRQANEALYDDFTEVDMFVTVFCGQYTPQTRQMLYSNAGHAPVIYRQANGKAHLLEAETAPIGVLMASFAENQVLTLCPGDVLVIATDGFSEAKGGQPEMLGSEHLLGCVDACADGTAKAIGRALFQTVQQYTAGHPQEDDQTLIVLKGM